MRHDFYPRPPRGGRPQTYYQQPQGQLISIHALREEGDVVMDGVTMVCSISIHALREEGDDNKFYGRYASNISIHALREEGDDVALPAGNVHN